MARRGTSCKAQGLVSQSIEFCVRFVLSADLAPGILPMGAFLPGPPARFLTAGAPESTPRLPACLLQAPGPGRAPRRRTLQQQGSRQSELQQRQPNHRRGRQHERGGQGRDCGRSAGPLPGAPAAPPTRPPVCRLLLPCVPLQPHSCGCQGKAWLPELPPSPCDACHPCCRWHSSAGARSTGWGRCARQRRPAWSATRSQVSKWASARGTGHHWQGVLLPAA